MTIIPIKLYNVDKEKVEDFPNVNNIDFVAITYSWCSKDNVDNKELKKLGAIIKNECKITYIWIDQLCVKQPPNIKVDHHTFKDFYLNCKICIICPTLSGVEYDFGFERWKKSRWTAFEVYYSQQNTNRCYIINKKEKVIIYNNLNKDFPDWVYK